MIYCNNCGDKHENSGECNYCDCPIELVDRGATQNTPFCSVYGKTQKATNVSIDDIVTNMRNRIRSKAVDDAAYKRFSNLRLNEMIQRLIDAEKVVDHSIDAGGSGYHMAKEYREKYPSL